MRIGLAQIDTLVGDLRTFEVWALIAAGGAAAAIYLFDRFYMQKKVSAPDASGNRRNSSPTLIVTGALRRTPPTCSVKSRKVPLPLPTGAKPSAESRSVGRSAVISALVAPASTLLLPPPPPQATRAEHATDAARVKNPIRQPCIAELPLRLCLPSPFESSASLGVVGGKSELVLL